MNRLASLWNDLPLPVVLIAGFAALVAIIAIAWPHLRRMRQRRQWRKLPPPPKRVETQEPVLRLPRRYPGDRPPEA
jgi:hypothetical protein